MNAITSPEMNTMTAVQIREEFAQKRLQGLRAKDAGDRIAGCPRRKPRRYSRRPRISSPGCASQHKRLCYGGNCQGRSRGMLPFFAISAQFVAYTRAPFVIVCVIKNICLYL